MSRDYAALMIDLKKSRSYTKEDRNSIQYYIMDVINLLNRLYRREIVREVDFSAGDEIQGLFASAEAAYLYYRIFSMWLHPVEIRAGIGVGGWDVQIDYKGTTSQDGPAYHNARLAIKHADDSEGYPVLFFSGSRSDITINTIIGGAASIMAKQSAYQNQIMLMTELLFPICNYYVRAYDYITPRDIERFLYEKSEFDHEVDKIMRPLPLDRLTGSIIEMIDPINAEDVREETKFYITSGKQRGIPTKLASIMDISRQTIEKTMKAGNIYTARNMAITAINEMTNTRWER
ncbi:MAG: SatD family protein [Faecousia sp.]